MKGIFGYYNLQPENINDKPHYVSDDGKNAIWYVPWEIKTKRLDIHTF